MSTLDLRPQRVDLKLRRNDAWSIRVTLTGLDLTGYDIAAQIRDMPDSAAATDLTISPTDLPNGVIHIGQTAASASGYWDLQLTPPAGLPRTYVAGRVDVEKDITRP